MAKFRKPRKPMSAEQKKAAAERLAKAREARFKKNPPKYTNVHPNVLALDEDNELSLKNVREWRKITKEKIAAEKDNLRRDKNYRQGKLRNLERYITTIDRYIQDGEWTGDRIGENQEHKMGRVCVAPAYDSDGNIKRTKGVFYYDLNCVYGESNGE